MSGIHEKDTAQILENIREFSNRLSSLFVRRKEVIEDMVIAAIAQEPLLFIGPPASKIDCNKGVSESIANLPGFTTSPITLT